VPDGIKNLTVTTQLIFSGSAGTFKLNVNGIEVGSIPYSAALTTTTISGINITGNVTVTINGNSSTINRVRFDDLSWSCENSLSTTDFNFTGFTIYPNPSNGNIKINFNDSTDKHQVQIFSILGQKVFDKEYSNISTAVINSIKTGVYIVKITKNNKSETKKLIVN
jgi:hypothetical protein